MTLKDAIVKVVLKRDDASFNEVKKKFEEIEKKKNKLKEEVKIGVNLTNAGIAITNLQRVQAELQKIKSLNKSIGKVSLDDGRTAYINKYGDIGFNRNRIVSNAINERKMRELDAINKQSAKTTRENEKLVNKMSMTGEIMRGALMTVGYQVVNLIQRGASEIIESSNKALKIQSQVATLTDDKISQKVFEKEIYKIAYNSYGDVNDVSDLFVKVGQNAKTLGYTGEDVSKLTQAVFDAFAVGGVSENAQTGAVQQLIQTIAKGQQQAMWTDIRLLEDDALEVAKMASKGLGLKGGVAELKKVISEGKISGKQFGDAIIKMAKEERELFLKSNKVTIEQAIRNFKTGLKEAVGRNPEAFSKIAKGLIKITDKIFSKKGLFDKVLKDVGKFFDNLDIDKYANKLEHIFNLLGKVYDLLGGITGIASKGIALYALTKIISSISTLSAGATTFSGILSEISKNATILSKKFIVITAIVVAIIGAMLIIQDIWTALSDPTADTIFGKVVRELEDIIAKVKEFFGIEPKLDYMGDKKPDNAIPESSLWSRFNSFLPESMRGASGGLTFNVNQIFNGNVDDKTAENYKQASKDMADMTENRYSEYYMADYRG